MNQFSNEEGRVIVAELIKVIEENKQYLSDIDGQIGDGDHGINMNKGFSLCKEQLEKTPGGMSHGFAVLSKVLMTKIGGSMGPLYGFLFREMSNVSKDAEQIDAAIFEAMLTKARQGIEKISPAKPGDKTLMDVLVPAQEAFTAAVGDSQSFGESLDVMSRAAREGRDSTKDMVAKLGRSSRLGERSRGVLDAGAASCCLILETMAEAIKPMLNGD